MSKDWIQHAIKHHGAATAKAKAEGLTVHEWAEKHKGDGGVTGHQAELALTLEGMHHKGKDMKEEPKKEGKPAHERLYPGEKK